jgi:hypothetical protein
MRKGQIDLADAMPARRICRCADPGCSRPSRWEPRLTTRRVVSGHSNDAIPATPSTPNEAATLQGPSLYRVMGRRAAAVPGFPYSDSMKRRAGLVSDAATLERYIADPESIVAGTSMSTPPLRDEQERIDLNRLSRALGSVAQLAPSHNAAQDFTKQLDQGASNKSALRRCLAHQRTQPFVFCFQYLDALVALG